MKKYSEVLAEQEAKHKPMTDEQLVAMKNHHGPARKGTEKYLLDEIEYLRSVLAECYIWMGRRVTSPLPKKYQWAMAECWKIHTEGKE